MLGHTYLALSLRPVDFERLREREAQIRTAKHSANTRDAYARGWRVFSEWCAAAHESALPAAPETLRHFATWCITEGYRLGTVTLRLSAIAWRHTDAGFASPVDASVREYLRQARRDLRERPAGKAALSYPLLQKIVSAIPDTPIGVRNRAMILLGFASGWRRSEILPLHSDDLAFVREGLELWQRASKTDQEGEGRAVGIQPGARASTCPVKAVRDWMALRGDWRGPVFVRFTAQHRMTREGLDPASEVLHHELKKLLDRAGVDARAYGAHSLRAGMITEAAKNGASEAAIMQRTGHRKSSTLQRYIRPATCFAFNPLRGVL